jgi:hypothetical protein
MEGLGVGNEVMWGDGVQAGGAQAAGRACATPARDIVPQIRFLWDDGDEALPLAVPQRLACLHGPKALV